MKNRLSFCLLLACLCISSGAARAGIGWIVDVLPGAVTANFMGDNFKATGEGQEEEISLVSSIPSMALGMLIDMPSGYIGLRGGGGLLLNSRVRSFLYYADVSASFEVERSVLLGPHIGMITFSDVEWWGDADIDFSDSTGLIIGMHLTMGDKISYLLSVDYFSAVFDVERRGAGWDTSDDKMDLSGLSVQFGFRANF